MGVMRAHKEQTYRHSQEKLLRRCVLRAIIDLLPHVQIVECSGIELERHTPHPVEHQITAEHVADVCESPGGFLRHGWDDVVNDLKKEDQDYVDNPGTCIVSIVTKPYLPACPYLSR
jgi:hypothetical protein